MKVLLRGARQLLTLRGSPRPRRGAELRDLGIIEEGAVLIEDDLISHVGTTRRLENLAECRDAEVIDVKRRVVMPGFIDSHTHLICGPPRLTDYEMHIAGASYREITQAGGGIPLTVGAVRAMTAPQLEWEARRHLNGMIAHGTTTVEAKSGYGLDESTELKSLRVITALDGHPIDVISTYLGAHVVPAEYQGRADEYVDWMCSYMLPLVWRRKLARFVDVYCEPGAFTIVQSRRYLEAARALRFGLKLHVDQFERTGGAWLAVQLAATSADHLECAEASDALALANANTIATLLPGCAVHLGLDRFAPARILIDAGAAVALATDFNMGTSPTYNMQFVLSLACTQMRMTPAEAISASTINAAHALGIADRAGSIEYGKLADLLIVDASDYREIPYFLGVNIVNKVMKRGKIIYERPGA